MAAVNLGETLHNPETLGSKFGKVVPNVFYFTFDEAQ